MRIKNSAIVFILYGLLLSHHLAAYKCAIMHGQAIATGDCQVNLDAKPLLPLKALKAENEYITIQRQNLIGAGAFGSVSSGTMTWPVAIPVVIKQIELRVPKRDSDLDGNLPDIAPTLNETKTEFDTMKLLCDKKGLKPYMIEPYAFFECGNKVFIVMEPGGEPLSNLMAELRNDHARLEKIALQIFRALNGIHEAGFVHLDLTPSNILVDSDDQAKIIDFGLTKPMGRGILGSGNIFYRDPNVYTIRRAYPLYDFFSLAAIIFEIMKGKNIYSYVDTEKNLGENLVEPGTENYKKFAEIHKSFLCQCSNEKPCSKLFLLALFFLNPDVNERRWLTEKR